MKDTKLEQYNRIYLQLEELFNSTEDVVSRMSTMAALLHHKMKGFFWTGFYMLNNDELCVGPYQGSLACLKLEKGKGVCWTAINRKETIVVDDVHAFPGHIACDSRSNSEIVVPVFDKADILIGVLDVDSTNFAQFDETDKVSLQKIVKLLYN
jgi:L-methionine (R)-S-oxide reductase